MMSLRRFELVLALTGEATPRHVRFIPQYLGASPPEKQLDFIRFRTGSDFMERDGMISARLETQSPRCWLKP